MNEHIHYGFQSIRRKRRYFRKVSVYYHIIQSSLLFLHDAIISILHIADYVWYYLKVFQPKIKSLDDLSHRSGLLCLSLLSFFSYKE